MTRLNRENMDLFVELVAVVDDVSGGRIGYHIAQALTQKDVSTVVPFLKDKAIKLNNIAPLSD